MASRTGTRVQNGHTRIRHYGSSGIGDGSSNGAKIRTLTVDEDTVADDQGG